MIFTFHKFPSTLFYVCRLLSSMDDLILIPLIIFRHNTTNSIMILQHIWILSAEVRTVEGHLLKFCKRYKCPAKEKFHGQSENYCSCLPQCVVWGTCCYDYHDHNPYNETLEQLRVASRCYEFWLMHTSETTADVFFLQQSERRIYYASVVGTCPDGTDEALATICRGHEQVYDSLRDWYREFMPVLLHGILFRNEACILCHGLNGNLQRFVPSNKDWYDLPMVSMNFMKRHLSLLDDARQTAACKDDPCTVSLSQPIYSGRKNITDLNNLCDKYTASTQLSDGKRYSNPFCAKCVPNLKSEDPKCFLNAKVQTVVIREGGNSGTYKAPKVLESLPEPSIEILKVSKVNFYMTIIQKTIAKVPSTQFIIGKIRRLSLVSQSIFLNFIARSIQPKTIVLNCLSNFTNVLTAHAQLLNGLVREIHLGMDMYHMNKSSPFTSITRYLPLFTSAGILYHDDYVVANMVVHASLKTINLQCSEKYLVKLPNNIYVISSSDDGVDRIEIINDKIRYLVDNRRIKMDYHGRMNTWDSRMNIHTALTICTSNVRIKYVWLVQAEVYVNWMSIAATGFMLVFHLRVDYQPLAQNSFCHFCLAVVGSLLVAVSFTRPEENAMLCAILAMFDHFFRLATFFWTNVLTHRWWNSTRKIQRSMSESSLHYTYCLYAWSVPLVITITGITLTYGVSMLNFAYGNDERCWLVSSLQILMAFLVPVGVISFSNCVLLVCVLVNYFKQRENCARREYELLPIVISSILSFIAYSLDFIGIRDGFFGCLSIIMHASQGLFALLAFSLNPNIRNRFPACRIACWQLEDSTWAKLISER